MAHRGLTRYRQAPESIVRLRLQEGPSGRRGVQGRNLRSTFTSRLSRVPGIRVDQRALNRRIEQGGLCDVNISGRMSSAIRQSMC